MQLNRDAFVRAASELMREEGVAAATIDAISARAGLTHGSFYKQFGSKQALLVEAMCAAAAERRSAVECAIDEHGANARAVLIDWYLSESHRDTPAMGCAVAAMVGDAARDESGELRVAYVQAVEDLLAAITANGIDDAYCAAALMVGALELARATKGTPLSTEFLNSARERLAT
jgi:TetR/AcrR family transcriptional repressor of nem operon